MVKKLIEVEVDIPAGFEFVRFPFNGESLTCDGDTFCRVVVNGSLETMAVLRKLWQWPEWLTAEWIAMDRDGGWWCYGDKPRLNDLGWSPCGGTNSSLRPCLTTFTPPPCTDWRQSLRRNPSL